LTRIDSPFWKVVKYAKNELELCLTILQFDGAPDMVNDPAEELSEVIPGADGQVHVVFPLITLIFATFDIPVPRSDSALWNAKTIGENQASQGNPRVSVYTCMDLEARAPWYTDNAGNKDRHHLKENLRNGIFDAAPELSPRAVAALMPWSDGGGYSDDTVLQNLVGAVKRLQADYTTPTVWDPLSDVQTHCEAALADLRETRKELQHVILRETVGSVTKPAPLTKQERDEM
jgi:hypothetical protein